MALSAADRVGRLNISKAISFPSFSLSCRQTQLFFFLLFVFFLLSFLSIFSLSSSSFDLFLFHFKDFCIFKRAKSDLYSGWFISFGSVIGCLSHAHTFTKLCSLRNDWCRFNQSKLIDVPIIVLYCIRSSHFSWIISWILRWFHQI